MYGGNSGCFGMIIYDTKKEGSNAVYGYYDGERKCFETGTVDEMKDFKKDHEKRLAGRPKGTGKVMGIGFLVYLAVVIGGFVVLPLRAAIAIMIFAVITYAPSMVIAAANNRSYEDAELMKSFQRFHGCEHSIIDALTKGRECTAESIRRGRIYDPECGTAYSGYIVFLALELALLIIFWPGILKSLGILLLSVVVLVVMIIKPAINPFTLFQRPVVLRPTERECELGMDIINKLKEL